MTAAWKKKLHFILSVRSDFLSIVVQAFASRVLMSISVDETASKVGELVHKFQRTTI